MSEAGASTQVDEGEYPAGARGNGRVVRRVIRKRIRKKADGIDIAADVNAVIAVNDGERRSRTSVSSRRQVIQRGEDPDAKGEKQREHPPEGED